jgi:cell division transport system permease protein
MVTASIMDDLRSFRRSWVHHTGMQLATLTVLAATFTVVGFAMTFSLNLKKVVAGWGDSAQLTVYMKEDADEAKTEAIRKEILRHEEISEIKYIPREQATENFKSQMASYAPDLLSDNDFSNPFPSSFRVSLKGGVQNDSDVAIVEKLSSQLSQIEGVEDISYGQSWIRNYSAFVSTLTASGGVVAMILLAGSLFVISNSIRASVSARRDEIEILELVGATTTMVRRPYIAEGFLMGTFASLIAIGLNFAIYLWQISVMSKSFVLARLVQQFSFFDCFSMAIFVGLCAALGAFGAWCTVRKINDGWSASQRLEA